MSHKTETKVERFDEEALRETFAALGVRWEENSTWVAYDRKQSAQCDFVVPYMGNEAALGNRMWSGGVGFTRDGDNLNMVMDGLDKTRPAVAEFLRDFQRTYTLKAATKQLERFGYVVEAQADGTFRARATLKTTVALASHRAKSTGVAQIHVHQGRY